MKIGTGFGRQHKADEFPNEAGYMRKLLGRFLRAGFAVLRMTFAAYGAKPFVHPGALDSKSQLDYVKAQIKVGAQPWTTEFNRLKAASYATRTAHGKTTINSNGSDATISRDDAIAAYTQALLWYYTGEVTYANRSIAILNSWSD